MKPGIDFQRTPTSSTKYEAILETTFEYQRCRRSSIPSSLLGAFWNPKGVLNSPHGPHGIETSTFRRGLAAPIIIYQYTRGFVFCYCDYYE